MANHTNPDPAYPRHFAPIFRQYQYAWSAAITFQISYRPLIYYLITISTDCSFGDLYTPVWPFDTSPPRPPSTPCRVAQRSRLATSSQEINPFVVSCRVSTTVTSNVHINRCAAFIHTRVKDDKKTMVRRPKLSIFRAAQILDLDCGRRSNATHLIQLKYHSNNEYPEYYLYKTQNHKSAALLLGIHQVQTVWPTYVGFGKLRVVCGVGSSSLLNVSAVRPIMTTGEKTVQPFRPYSQR